MFGCFKKKELKEIPAVKWGIVCGHKFSAQGSTTKNPPLGYDENLTEYMYNIDMCDFLADDVHFAYRDVDDIRGAASTLSNMLVTGSVEIHGNSFNTKVSGAEILVLKDDKVSEYYAEHFIEHFRAMFPDRKLRHGNGIKYISRGNRGYNNLVTAKKHGMDAAILSELFFIDNYKDWLSPEEQAEFWNGVLF